MSIFLFDVDINKTTQIQKCWDLILLFCDRNSFLNLYTTNKLIYKLCSESEIWDNKFNKEGLLWPITPEFEHWDSAFSFYVDSYYISKMAWPIANFFF